jgi:hemerythrin-like domain-containing protein
MNGNRIHRREFLTVLPVAGLALGAAPAPRAQQVTPTEDLMREHGVLERVLLIYDELRHQLDAHGTFPPALVIRSAEVIRSFIESYHEKLEEEHIFPMFRKKNTMVDLVNVLETQHLAGRGVTNHILALAHGGLKTGANKRRLALALHQFVRMYAPHEAREDTVLFPAFRQMVTPAEFDALGEEFEKRERQLFGRDGFEGMVRKVAEIEKALGIYDLAQFTPLG